jgi:hypothetical protein
MRETVNLQEQFASKDDVCSTKEVWSYSACSIIAVGLKCNPVAKKSDERNHKSILHVTLWIYQLILSFLYIKSTCLIYLFGGEAKNNESYFSLLYRAFWNLKLVIYQQMHYLLHYYTDT